MKNYKIAVAGTGYVGLSLGVLLSQHHQVVAVDIVQAKVDMINNKKSPIQDDYIEKYLAEKDLNLTATLDAKAAYSDADFVVIAAPTNYDSKTQHFDTSAVEAVIKLVMEYNPNAIMVIKSTIPVGYTASVREKFNSKNIIFGLYKAFDEQGIGYAKTAVGDKYVYEYMAKNGCRIGGEQSGHIIFSKYASTGDGILTSLKMMEVMLAKKKPMSELAAPLKIYPQVLENVSVTDKKAAQNDPAVQEAVSKVAEALGDTGRILVRESGTEPVVRVMVEAPDHDTCQKYVSEVVDVIRDRGYSL